MSDYDPYAAPAASLEDGPGGGGSGETISSAMVASLVGTGGWVRLFSVLGMLGAIFMVLGAGFMLLAGIGIGFAEDPAAGAGMAGLGVLYLSMALLYVVPTLHLHRFASAISRVKNGLGAEAFEQAMHHQQRFWRFLGISFVVLMCVYALIFVGMIVLGVLGAAVFPDLQ